MPVFDISTPGSSELTGAYLSPTHGNDVAVDASGSYALLVSFFSEIRIFDISDPFFPQRVPLADVATTDTLYLDSNSDRFKTSGIQVLVLIPDKFADQLAKMNQLLAEGRNESLDEIANYPRPTIIQNSADEKSLIAAARVRAAIRSWEDEILKRRLAAANLPESVHKPVKAAQIDLAQDEPQCSSVTNP